MSASSAPAPPSAASLPEPKGEKEIVRRFEGLVARQRSLVAKLAEMDGQRLEYARVAATLAPMAPERRAYQLINSVLVERTVGEVAPLVATNRDYLATVIAKLNDDLREASDEVREYQKKYNIRVTPRSVADAAAAPDAAQSVGVLA